MPITQCTTICNHTYRFIVCLLSVTLGCVANCADIQTASFPVPIRVDQGWIRSSLFIKCSFKPYRVPLREFGATPLDPRELAFKRLVAAVGTNDVATCLDLNSHSKTNIQHLTELALTYKQTYGSQFNSLLVSDQFYRGKSSLFIWGVSLEPGSWPVRRSFKITTDSENIPYWDADNRDCLDIVITDIMQKAAKLPAVYAPSKTVQRKFQYPISGTTNGSPVYLQFDGKTYDFDAFGPDIPPGDEVASYYQAAYKTFMNGRKEDFSTLYTESSGKKYLNWVLKMRPEEFDAYHQHVIKSGRRVRFILNADPIFIVFYCSGSSAGGALDLSYEYVARDPTSRELKLTNFYSESFIDDLLKSKDLFVTPILNDILSRSASASAKQPR